MISDKVSNNNQSNEFTVEDLKRMQEWDLDTKISVSLTRISEFYNHFPNKIYISFSDGKDSTVLLHLVRSLYPNTPALFINTGLEYPEIVQFVKTIDNVIMYRPKMSFKKVIEKYGYPIISKSVAKLIKDGRKAIEKGNEESSYAITQLKGEYYNKNTGELSKFNYAKWSYLLDAPFKISPQCCDVMKKQTAHSFEKEYGLKPIIGTMASESRLRKTQWLTYGCNAFKGRIQSKPLSFWTENDILAYLKRYNLKYASVYGDIKQDDKGNYYTTGCNRTGCIFCMYGCYLEKEPNRFQKLKITHPKLWEYCMRDWNKGGLGMREVLDYIGVKIE